MAEKEKEKEISASAQNAGTRSENTAKPFSPSIGADLLAIVHSLIKWIIQTASRLSV